MEQENRSHALLYPFLSIGSFVYAIFYTFCLYKNASGITYPFFVGGTLFFFFLCLKKFGITAKRDSIYYVISILLLGISTCLTDSFILHFLNKLGILTLMLVLFLHTFYEDKKWTLPKYFCSVMNLIFTPFSLIARPFTDLKYYKELKGTSELPKSTGKLRYILFGCLLAFPLLLIVILLLSTADPVFAMFFKDFLNVFERFFENSNFFGLLFCTMFAFFAAYCMFVKLTLRNIKEDVTDKRTAEPILAITVTTLVSLIYFLFCGIQIIYLFLGYGTLPEGYTYASYARQGFFQLVFICLLNLIIVHSCILYFRPHVILTCILTFISACTYIMIASSAYRMLLYIKVYHLTFLRVFVLWALFVMFLLLTGLVIMIYKKQFPLFRYYLVTVTVLYLLFSFAKPDSLIASYNIDAYDSSSENASSGLEYLHSLSLDAAPVILSHEDVMSSYVTYLSMDVEEEYENMNVRTFNFSKWLAYLATNSQ